MTEDRSATKSALAGKLKHWLALEPGEAIPLLDAFCWFACLMSGYYLLRPIREALGAGLGSEQISWLFLVTFLVMLLAVPAYGKLVSVFDRRWMVRSVFGFFASNILLFALAIGWLEDSQRILLAQVYFVWVSVFNLFAVSVFWSVLADTFSSQQGKRLFGLVAAGATTGAIIGSIIASLLVGVLGLAGLLVLAATLIGGCTWFADRLLGRRQQLSQNLQDGDRVSESLSADRGVWAGLTELGKSRYLQVIAIYLALISGCGTIVYLQLADEVKLQIPDEAGRTSFFAKINLVVQIGTLVVQTFLFSRVVRWLGLSTALIALPIVYLFSFFTLGVSGSLAVLAVIETLRRIIVYGMTVPSREVLFTVVSTEAKYKSKNFIDTVVFRGSDTVASRMFVSMVQWLGSARLFSFAMLPLTVLWIAAGWWLGKRQAAMAIHLPEAKQSDV